MGPAELHGTSATSSQGARSHASAGTSSPSVSGAVAVSSSFSGLRPSAGTETPTSLLVGSPSRGTRARSPLFTSPSSGATNGMLTPGAVVPLTLRIVSSSVLQSTQTDELGRPLIRVEVDEGVPVVSASTIDALVAYLVETLSSLDEEKRDEDLRSAIRGVLLYFCSFSFHRVLSPSPPFLSFDLAGTSIV